MNWMLYEAMEDSEINGYGDSPTPDPMAVLDDQDLIAIRQALATVSHKGDCYSKAWHKLMKATDKAMEGDR